MPGIVLNPTAGDVHVNTPLTMFAQKYLLSSDMFISQIAMPNLPVAKQSDLYYEFSRADFFRDEAEERADGTESAGGGFKLATNPYFARVYAFHKDVTDRQRANQDSVIQLDNSATQFVTLKMMLRRERVFQSTYMTPNVWFNGGTSASAGQDVDWSGTTDDPIVQIRDAIRGVHGRTGLRPNKMIIDRRGWDTLLDNDAVLARITGGATTSMPAMVMRELLAQLFELQAIYVMDSVYNAAQETIGADPLNQGENTQFIAPNHCLLYYAPDGVGLEEPTAGLQFSWTGFMGATSAGMRIKRFRMEPTESDRIEGQMSFDYKVVAPELGHLFINVSS